MQVGQQGYIPYLNAYPLAVEYVGSAPGSGDYDEDSHKVRVKHFYRALEPLERSYQDIKADDIIDDECEIMESGTAAAFKVLEDLIHWRKRAEENVQDYRRQIRNVLDAFTIVPPEGIE